MRAADYNLPNRKYVSQYTFQSESGFSQERTSERFREQKKEIERKLRSSLKKGLKYAEMPHRQHESETSDSSIELERFPTFNQNKYSASSLKKKSTKKLSITD